MKVPFTKVESIGNDFVLVEASDIGLLSEDGLRSLAIKACERRFGIGSDGLLVISKSPTDQSTHQLVLRMFNPDGSEDFCGNGLRCAAAYAHRQGWVGEELAILHLGRLVPCEILPYAQVRTNIGRASFRPADVPLDECSGELFMASMELEDATLTISALTTGSTHVVIFCDELPHDREFVRLSSAIEHHPLFPMRTSVIWAKEVEAEPSRSYDRRSQTADILRIRIWERGAGETLGCGTGSSAAAVVHMRRSEQRGTVVIENPGGEVTVSAASWDAPLSIEGQAHILFRGVLEH